MKNGNSRCHRILIASNNRHKIREFRGLLEPAGFVVVTPQDFNLTLEVEETGSTFSENAILKAEAFRDATQMLSLADDSGLVVDALDGRPGVFSARYGDPSLDDAGRTALVLSQMQNIERSARSARFVAVIAIAEPGKETSIFRGVVEGRIAFEAAGAGGFGYDPIFYFPELGCTLAELGEDEKVRISHRGRAARLAARYLQTGEKDGILDKTQRT